MTDSLIEFPSYFNESPVELDSNTSTVILVDNVPITKMNRYEKLVTVIRKIFSAYGQIIDEGLIIPVEGSGDAAQTCGYAFIEYSTAEEANRAVSEGNNKKLDNAHTLLVNHYDDYNKYSSVPLEWNPPNKTDFQSKVNLTSWLLDNPAGRDQFLVRHSRELQIYWNDPFRCASDYGRSYKYGGEREKSADKTWTDLYTAWSNRGSYLATFHLQGIALWGGDSFEKLGRFAHSGVAQIDFSPNEKYIVTSSNTVQTAGNEAIIVWDVRQQKKLRGFEKNQSITATDNNNTIIPVSTVSAAASSWPIMRWSSDDKYVARLSKDTISIYELPLMGLLDKKSLKIPEVADFSWSPSNNYLAYWIPEHSNHPATVAIIEIPSRKIIREKHLYNVIDMKLHWNDSGDFLCMKVLRKKTKKTITTNFEIFRMREKDIPIEVLEIENEQCLVFQWEPAAGILTFNAGHRFAIIHSPDSNPTRTSVSIYSIKGKKISKVNTFESRQCNALFWSPAGNQLLLAGLGSMNGQLEFIDTESVESLSVQEHFMCNEIEWSPCGRYVITAVTQPIGETSNWRLTMDNGYRLWSVQGQLLATVPLEQCYQILWRPRPKNLLSKELLTELHKSLKDKYWRQFESEDNEIRRSQLQGRDKERSELKSQWKQYRAAKEREYNDEREMRRSLRGGYASDDESDYIMIEQLVDEEISREEEIVQ